MSLSAVGQTHTFQMHDHLSVDIPMETVKEKDPADKGELSMFAEEEPSFWDFLDVINPLQHIPVVNTLYREATGDEIGVGARLTGGALFGGAIGLIASAINCLIEEGTGKDVGGHVMALFQDDAPAVPGDEAPAPTAVAMAAPIPAAPLASAAPPPVAEPSGTPLAFTADGQMYPPAPQPPVAAGATAESVATAPAARPMPLFGQQPARFMPVPQRAMPVAGHSPLTPITVPVSNSGTRSNVPITGRDPVAQVAPDPAKVQRILDSQGQKTATRPTAPTADGASQDWFTSAMMTGLNKYEQAAKLNRPGESALVPLQ